MLLFHWNRRMMTKMKKEYKGVFLPFLERKKIIFAYIYIPSTHLVMGFNFLHNYIEIIIKEYTLFALK